MTPIRSDETRVRHNCRIHGITEGYVIAPKGRKPWTRCVSCELESRRASRAAKRRATQPNAAPGEFIRGLRTTYGLNTVRAILPIEESIWKWLENKHEGRGSTKTLLVNQLLSDAIARADPKFKPPVD